MLVLVSFISDFLATCFTCELSPLLKFLRCCVSDGLLPYLPSYVCVCERVFVLFSIVLPRVCSGFFVGVFLVLVRHPELCGYDTHHLRRAGCNRDVLSSVS